MHKDILQRLDETEGNLCRQLDENIFPRLYSILQEEYGKLTGAYEDRLRERAEHYLAEGRQAAARAAALQEQLDRVAALRPAAV